MVVFVCLLASFVVVFAFIFWCSFAWYIDVKNYNVSFLIFPFDEYAVSFPVFFSDYLWFEIYFARY